MHVKTMEGLSGAHTNYNLLKVPFRVYKDARRRGDLGVMERAMGYVSDFAGKSQEYQAEAEEGMAEERCLHYKSQEAGRQSGRDWHWPQVYLSGAYHVLHPSVIS